MKNKLILTLVIFLLLVPFRLPISILFIDGIKWLLGETTPRQLPVDVIATNVIVTKSVYNIVLSVFFVFNVESLSRKHFGRKAQSSGFDEPIYWYILPISVMLLAFIIMDANNINSIFFK